MKESSKNFQNSIIFIIFDIYWLFVTCAFAHVPDRVLVVAVAHVVADSVFVLLRAGGRVHHLGEGEDSINRQRNLLRHVSGHLCHLTRLRRCLQHLRSQLSEFEARRHFGGEHVGIIFTRYATQLVRVSCSGNV